MEHSEDPFREKRQEDGVLPCEFQGEVVPMILRHPDVKAAAKDIATYSSDAPFRVVIPSEEDVRSMRQLPIEVDPPEHTEYRKLVEPFFKRPKDPEVIAQVEALIERSVEESLTKDSVEIVRDFALPIQSVALTYLLDVPEEEAEVWIGWGIHVFRDGESGEKKGAALETYLQEQFDKAEANPGEDFYSALLQAEYQGRKLTREEVMGFANLAFAGGRDTVIQSIASIMGYLGRNAEALPFLREDPKRVVNAGEEFFRVVTPLTHIGRVCPVSHEVKGVPVQPKGRVSLCWASANHDETVFDAPEEIRLDRKPNPHMAFGIGAHLCLGAAHARLLVRSLLKTLSEKVERIEILEAVDHVEQEAEYTRKVGYEAMHVRLVPSD